MSQLKVAYVIQNVGGIDFAHDLGDTVPVKHTILGLQRAGNEVSCYRLHGNSVNKYDDLSNPDNYSKVKLGLSGLRLFRLFEGGIRRLQNALGLPYLALFDSFRTYEVLIRTLKLYDLCHEHNGLFCIGATLACRRLKKPYVLTVSADPFLEREYIGEPVNGLAGLLARRIAKLNYKTANKIICVSRPSKQHLIDEWGVDPEKIVVMPNGVDVDLFNSNIDLQARRSQLGLTDALVVCFVGTFQLWHGLDNLIDIFASVLKTLPKSKLLLVGDGPARSVIEDKIEEYGIGCSVIITGLISQSKVTEMLSIADIAVAPYPRFSKELWFSPLKLYEYMAAGKAIVASNSGQISEVILDGVNGILIDPEDKIGFANAIVHLLVNPQLRSRIGKSARQQAVEKHSWENYIQRVEKIYSSVL